MKLAKKKDIDEWRTSQVPKTKANSNQTPTTLKTESRASLILAKNRPKEIDRGGFADMPVAKDHDDIEDVSSLGHRLGKITNENEVIAAGEASPFAKLDNDLTFEGLPYDVRYMIWKGAMTDARVVDIDMTLDALSLAQQYSWEESWNYFLPNLRYSSHDSLQVTIIFFMSEIRADKKFLGSFLESHRGDILSYQHNIFHWNTPQPIVYQLQREMYQRFTETTDDNLTTPIPGRILDHEEIQDLPMLSTNTRFEQMSVPLPGFSLESNVHWQSFESQSINSNSRMLAHLARAFGVKTLYLILTEKPKSTAERFYKLHPELIQGRFDLPSIYPNNKPPNSTSVLDSDLFKAHNLKALLLGESIVDLEVFIVHHNGICGARRGSSFAHAG